MASLIAYVNCVMLVWGGEFAYMMALVIVSRSALSPKSWSTKHIVALWHVWVLLVSYLVFHYTASHITQLC